MPRRRRGNYNRNDRRNDQPGTTGTQENITPPENSPVPEQKTSTGQENRPQRHNTGSHRGLFPREISPSEVNERLNQRKPPRQGNQPPKERPANQANTSPGRRTGPPSQAPDPGITAPRRNPGNRNPAGKNAPSKSSAGKNTLGKNGLGRNPRNTSTSGTGSPGSKTANAPRRGYYVQRSGHTDRPAPSVPIRTNKGIKARDQRGQFSQHWWARRWIEAMEGLVDQARLQRGRSYALSGQVLSIIETQNGIEARVQGSRPKPYEVTIQVTPLNDRQWDLVIDAMSEQALFTAQLLAGEMPSNIEDAFHTAGVSLFPSQTGDLSSDCTCPDWANPCKHVAATHYILGDRFDDDPFLLFRMRGRTQEEILEALRQRRADVGAGTVEAAQEEPPVEAEKITPLEELLDRFWEPAESLDKLPLTIKLASVDVPLLKRMGEPAFMGGESLQALLKPFYDTFTRSALRAAYSEEEPVESSNGQESF